LSSVYGSASSPHSVVFHVPNSSNQNTTISSMPLKRISRPGSKGFREEFFLSQLPPQQEEIEIGVPGENGEIEEELTS